MALLETLRRRAARSGGTAQVDCGALGVLTVEALSPADLTRLGGDPRALLYAACRDLQRSGEALRSEGRLFRPDEVTQYLTDDEAETAARTVLDISGMSEIRPSSVQGIGGESTEIRHESVQQLAARQARDLPASAQTGEIRRFSVQDDGGFPSENGQVSHESGQPDGRFTADSGSDRKSQVVGDLSAQAAQIVVPENGSGTGNGPQAGRGTGGLHKIKSEAGGRADRILHESTSESAGSGRGKLHESESESAGRGQTALHETGSESDSLLHEIRSELQKAMHEIKSEVRQILHENESELAEAAAQRLAEALRRAGQVR